MKPECTRTCCRKYRKELERHCHLTQRAVLASPTNQPSLVLLSLLGSHSPVPQTENLYLNCSHFDLLMRKYISVAKEAASSTSGPENNTDEQEQITIARALLNLTSMANNCPSVPVKFTQEADTCRSSHSEQGGAVITGSRILPNLVLHRPKSATRADGIISAKNSPRHVGADRCMIAPPVTIRTAVPVFSAPQQKKHHVPQKKHELQYRAAAPAPQLCVQLKEPPTTIPASRKQVYPVNFPDSLKESQGPASQET